MRLALGDGLPIDDGPNDDDVHFAADGDVESVRAPRETQKTSKVHFHLSDDLVRFVVDDAQKTVLTCECDEFQIGREFELIDAGLTDSPSTYRILSLALVVTDDDVAGLFRHGVMRRVTRAGKLGVVEIHVAASMGDEKFRFR